MKCAESIGAVWTWLSGGLRRDHLDDEINATHGLLDLVRVTLLPPVFGMVIRCNKDIRRGKLVACSVMHGHIDWVPINEFVEEFRGHLMTIHLVDYEDRFLSIIITVEDTILGRYNVHLRLAPRNVRAQCHSRTGLPGPAWPYEKYDERFALAGLSRDPLVRL